MTHVPLAQVSEELLDGALRTAWKLRIDKNKRTKRTWSTRGLTS